MIPILIWLDRESGTRRHSSQNRLAMLRTFKDAWRTYKMETRSPFRRNILDYRSATSAKPILEKCRLATKNDRTFIYVYVGRVQSPDNKNKVVTLSGNGLLDLNEFLLEVSSLAEHDTVVFVDAPQLEAIELVQENEKISLCWRTQMDFLEPDLGGCEPFLGSFARLFGAAVRNAPVFTLNEIFRAASSQLQQDFKQNPTIYSCFGSSTPLNTPLMELKVVPGNVAKTELANLASDNVGSFEDGLQAIIEVLNAGEFRQEASDLAFLFLVSDRFEFVHKQVRSILNHDQHNSVAKSRQPSLPSLSIVREILDDMVTIYEGVGVIGSKPSNDPDALIQEIPQHRVSHREFQIGKNQIRNWIWCCYLESLGAEPCGQNDDPNHPVRFVSFYDANLFLDWLERGAHAHGMIEADSKLVLPSEAEWEISARGRDGLLFPWGNTFEPFCNYRDNSKEKVVDVGYFSPQGDSPFGLADMAGNAWDWTRSLWGRGGRTPEFGYPYNSNDGRENVQAGRSIRRVVRGGAYYYFDWCLRSATRNPMFPSTKHSGGSFRIVKIPRNGTNIRPLVM